MKNERGFTLIEVLAVLVILTVVMGVCTMLLTSVNSLWNNTSQHQTDDTKYKLTLNILNRELADPTSIYYASANELRFITLDEGSGNGANYKSLYYNSTAKSLTLYELVSSSQYTTAMNPVSNASNYITRYVLADNIAPNPSAPTVPAFTIKDPNGTLTIAPTAALTRSTPYTQLVTISIIFENTRVTTKGTKINSYKKLDKTITLFK